MKHLFLGCLPHFAVAQAPKDEDLLLLEANITCLGDKVLVCKENKITFAPETTKQINPNEKVFPPDDRRSWCCDGILW